MTTNFTFGVAIPAPANDVRDIARLADDIEQTADFLVVTASAGESAGIAPASVLGFLAPRTTIGLVAEIDVSYVEPFFASKALATLDHVASGRAAWQLKVDTIEEAAHKRGLGTPLPPEELAERALEYVGVVRDLWDSWDSDAVVRDKARGIFIRADRVHHLDHVGRYFSVRGPAILPRPPQGHPPTFVSLTGEPGSLRLAREAGEIVRLRATTAEEVLAAAGQLPAARVVVDIPFTDLPEVLDLVDAVSPAAQGIVVEFGATGPTGAVLRALDAGLAERGLRARGPRAAAFRERLGLSPAVNRFALQEIS